MADLTFFKYPIPYVTFGVEFEFSFTIRRSHFFAVNNKVDTRGAQESLHSPLGPNDSISQRGTPTSPAFLSSISQQVSPTISTLLGPPSSPVLIFPETSTSIKKELPTDSSSDLSHSSGASHSSILIYTGTRTVSDDSQDVQHQRSLRNYVRRLLEHQLPSSPKSPSLLSPIQTTEPKIGPNYNTWQLTQDWSVVAHRLDYATVFNLPEETVKNVYMTGGAELISPVLIYDRQNVWYPMFQQIVSDFNHDDNQEIWFNDTEGLHVHMALKDTEMGMLTLRNLLCLYGLYENEIELWLDMRQRDNIVFCKSLRRSFEDRHFVRDDTVPGVERRVFERRYTPQEFTEQIHATFPEDTVRYLKAEAIGLCDIRENMNNNNNHTVNLSLSRNNKPLTIEFRQHKGTVDSETIYWWVTFLAKLLQYCVLLEQVGVRILDSEGAGVDGDISFVGELTKRSILDIISFPEEGKSYFARKKEELRDEGFDAKRGLEKRIIDERARRRFTGQETGRAMDREIRREPWCRDALRELLENHQIEIEFKDPDAEIEWVERDDGRGSKNAGKP